MLTTTTQHVPLPTSCELYKLRSERLCNISKGMVCNAKESLGWYGVKESVA